MARAAPTRIEWHEHRRPRLPVLRTPRLPRCCEQLQLTLLSRLCRARRGRRDLRGVRHRRRTDRMGTALAAPARRAARVPRRRGAGQLARRRAAGGAPPWLQPSHRRGSGQRAPRTAAALSDFPDRAGRVDWYAPAPMSPGSNVAAITRLINAPKRFPADELMPLVYQE